MSHQVPVTQTKTVQAIHQTLLPRLMTSVCKNGGEEAVWLARVGAAHGSP